jgi:biotin carboxyl carrier protein
MSDSKLPEIVAVEPGVYSVLLEGRSYEARVEDCDGAVIVFIDGHRFEIENRDPRRWSRRARRAGAEGRLNVAAPMPGKVVRLLVAEGDTVEAGQGLLVVEAMKMQNELKAAKAGRVVTLAARQGATVAAGEVLAVIE